MSGVSFAEAQAAVEARLSPRNAEHCRSVAVAAGELARVYDVDIELARLAGLLHDWDRERSAGDLLGEAERYGIVLTPTDTHTPHLLHARTGARSVAEAFPGLPREVIDAVERHTLGEPGMTPLDMVVYLADMIESHRDYPGVKALREAVGVVSLAELFALGYQQTVAHVVAVRREMHPMTVDVWNCYVAGEPR